MNERQQTEEKSKQIDRWADEAFARFLTKQEVKFMMSLIPEPSTADALSTLLKTSFIDGFHSGAGAFMQDALTALLRSRSKE